MKQFDISYYNTFIFDCDGVVLNSNKIKTNSFYIATKPYGLKPAQALVDYHLKNGGVSRYEKFRYFLTDILGQSAEKKDLDKLLLVFADEVKKGLNNCEVARGLDEFREKTKQSNWLIVSGGDQSELREMFSSRGLDKYFNAGIFGSPDNKDIILEREISCQNITMPGLFLGDSKYDYEAAKGAGLDFAYLSGWSESTYRFDEADYKFIDIESILHQVNGSN